MKIRIYSDPHIGLSRKANTTIQSSQRLQKMLVTVAEEIVSCKEDMVFCLGDLFDKFSNSEEVIHSAANIVKNTNLILAGNHDLENKAGSLGSLQLLSQLSTSSSKFIISPWGDDESFHVELGLTKFYLIPHMASQDLFEKALRDARDDAMQTEGKWRVLMTHCNYDLTHDIPDTALNMSSELAKELLGAFHYIFLGHEHIPKDLFNGKLWIVGNTYPTGFSDISDKRVLVYDTEDGSIESRAVAREEDVSLNIKASQLGTCEPLPFMDIEDDMPPGEANKLVSQLFNKSAVLAVRLRGGTAKLKGSGISASATLDNLPQTIAADLSENDPELLALWEELSDGA